MTKGDQSKFMSSAEQMKENLGPALCLAKWKQVSLHLPTGLNNSCYHPPLHKIPVENLATDPGSLHNTPHKKAQRVLMLRNEKPAECEYCWNMENEGKLSDRHYRSGESWAAVDFEKIRNSTGEESDVIPSNKKWTDRAATLLLVFTMILGILLEIAGYFRLESITLM